MIQAQETNPNEEVNLENQNNHIYKSKLAYLKLFNITF